MLICFPCHNSFICLLFSCFGIQCRIEITPLLNSWGTIISNHYFPFSLLFPVIFLSTSIFFRSFQKYSVDSWVNMFYIYRHSIFHICLEDHSTYNITVLCTSNFVLLMLYTYCDKNLAHFLYIFPQWWALRLFLTASNTENTECFDAYPSAVFIWPVYKKGLWVDGWKFTHTVSLTMLCRIALLFLIRRSKV